VDRFGHWEGAPQGRVQNTFQYGDTLTWIKGAHNLKFGGDFYRYQGNSYVENRPLGEFIFNTWADFAAGRPNEWQQRFGSTLRGHRTWIFGGFAQDDWRVTPTFTLNLGLRYEVYGPVSEVNNLISNLYFDCRESMGIAGTGPLGCVRVGQDAIGTNYYAQPRIGFAWNVRPKTVIRGGYGLVADFNFLNPITNMRGLPPLVTNQSIAGAANFTNGNTWGNLVAGTAPLQILGRSLVGVLSTTVRNYGDWNPLVDPGLKNPQIHQWSFGIQQELPQNIVLKLSYNGTKGNFLQRARQINLNANPPRPATDLADELARVAEFRASYNAMAGTPSVPSSRMDPRFNIVNYYDNSANSNYHGFEVFAIRSFREFYQFQFGYTFSKTIDDVSDALSAIPNDSTLIQNPLNARENRGPAGFDLRHRVVATHVVEFPWGDRIGNPIARRLLGGWGFSGISSWRSGFPISFESGNRLDILNPSVITTGGVLRPNAAGPFNFDPVPTGSAEADARQGLTGEAIAGLRISSYAAGLGLSQPLLGRTGNLGRNTHRLNGRTDFDWNLYKNTAITERINMQLRLEVYNVFNHHSFRDAVRILTSPAFGQYTASDQSQRFLQLGAVLRF
jgi:hypothetical protein